jgi:DNA-binding NarL/FixJ family response regulator
MITVCFADPYPVVQYGIKSYFENHTEIAVVATVGNFQLVQKALFKNKIDILVIDLKLDGLQNIYELKNLNNAFPETKILVFTSLQEHVYEPKTSKLGIYGYIHKSSKLELLGKTIVGIHRGELNQSQTNENLQKGKQIGIFRNLSKREIQVLQFLSNGKKNIEIANILNLNEKTISTYKKRLFQKLNITNVIDLVYKAKAIGII